MIKRSAVAINAAIPIAAGVVAYRWMPLESWGKLDQGLLVFLGLLVAALVQVIPVTANFLQSDQITTDEARRLTAALEEQQKYWLGLLGVSVITAMLLIVDNFAKGLLEFNLPGYGQVLLDPLLSSITAAFVALVAVKTFGFFPGVQSLQRLRSELVIEAAIRRERGTIEKPPAVSKPLPASVVPDDYGRIAAPD